MGGGAGPRALWGVARLDSSVFTEVDSSGGLEDMRTTAGLLGTGADVIRTTCLGTGDACERTTGDVGGSW